MSSPEYSCGERTSTSLVCLSSASRTSSRLRANRVVARLGVERRGRVRRHVGGRRAALADPLLARTVEQLDVVVPVVLEVPVGVGREPVVAVAVEHDQVVVGDPARAEQLAEGLGAEEVALDLVLEVLLPVEADRARDVRLGVERRVLVDLDDADRIVVEVILEPLGVDQYVLRVVSHGQSSWGKSLSTLWGLASVAQAPGSPGRVEELANGTVCGLRAIVSDRRGPRPGFAAESPRSAPPRARSRRPPASSVVGDRPRGLVDEAAHRRVDDVLAERAQAGPVKRRERVGPALGAAQQPARRPSRSRAPGRACRRRSGSRHPRLDPVGLERGARAGIARRPAHRVAVGAQGARQRAAAAPAADDQDPRQG